MKTFFFSIVFFATLSFGARAQTYEQWQMDSLRRIIDNPASKDADRIEPMARLSRIYQGRGDSVQSTQWMDRARTLAGKQKDKKYMIYVYNQALVNSLNAYPKNISLTYRIIDSIYAAIAVTADPEAQALGYDYIGNAKGQTDREYNFEDHFKAITIAEKLPESSAKKYRVLYDIYRFLFSRSVYKDKADAQKYLDLTLQAAAKSGDKNYLCDATVMKMGYCLDVSHDDKNAIQKNFNDLENFISVNEKYIDLTNYGYAVMCLMLACIDHLQSELCENLVNKHIEEYKTLAGNNTRYREQLLCIEINRADNQKKYAEAAEFTHELIKIHEVENPYALWADYKTLAVYYALMNLYKQAYEALEKSSEYFQQNTNAQMEEQRQLAEVKFRTAQTEEQIAQQQTKMLILTITAVTIIALLLTLLLLLNRQKTLNKLKKEKAELMAERALAEKERLSERLITNTAELTRKELLLKKVKDMDSKQLDKAIRSEHKTAGITKEFSKLFHEIRPEFFDWLAQQAAPNKLSKTDLRYCAYISLRMHNKDLANVMNVEYNTVVSQKHNLKKKFHLKPADSLDDFIVNFTPPPLTFINVLVVGWLLIVDYKKGNMNFTFARRKLQLPPS